MHPPPRSAPEQRRQRLRKRHSKSEVSALLQNLSRLFYLVQFVKCSQFFVEFNSKRLYRSSGKERGSPGLAFTFSTKRENRQFHVVIVQWRQRNVQESVMHVQSCCFANINRSLFWRSCWRRRRRCFSSLIHKHKAKTLDTPGNKTLWTWWTLICNNIENDHCFYYMTYISINPWSARSLDNRPVETSVTNLIFVTLFRRLNLTLMYVVYNFKWYRSFRSEVAQGWSYPIVQRFCCNFGRHYFLIMKNKQ